MANSNQFWIDRYDEMMAEAAIGPKKHYTRNWQICAICEKLANDFRMKNHFTTWHPHFKTVRTIKDYGTETLFSRMGIHS